MLGVAVLMVITTLSQAALKDGLVAYWPLDEVAGTKTPDRVSGYDMELANPTAADLVAGKVGKAFQFDNARQTMLKRVNSPGEQFSCEVGDRLGMPAIFPCPWNTKLTTLKSIAILAHAALGGGFSFSQVRAWLCNNP